MKLKITVLATLLLTALNVLAITIKWDVDATDARAQSFTAYHGETLTFATTFRADGLALSNVTALTIYYQTNGMGTAWWHTDGLTFAPSNDVGATIYRFFIAAADPTGTVYRANGTIRMLASPGYSPNALTLPRETIDFAAIDVSNAPWATTAALASMSNSIPKTAADVGALERSWQDESYGPNVVLLKRTMSNVTSPLFKATETPGPGSTIYSWYAEGFTVPWSKVTGAPEIPTALKCPNSITIKTNGVASVTYDGSVAQTIDLALGGGDGPGGTVAAATLEYHADGQAIEVSVAAAGTFSATLTDWPDGQSQMSFVTLAAGASVSPSIKLIGYSEWTTGEKFMAVATRRNNKIYLNPVCITEE